MSKIPTTSKLPVKGSLSSTSRLTAPSAGRKLASASQDSHDTLGSENSQENTTKISATERATFANNVTSSTVSAAASSSTGLRRPEVSNRLTSTHRVGSSLQSSTDTTSKPSFQVDATVTRSTEGTTASSTTTGMRRPATTSTTAPTGLSRTTARPTTSSTTSRSANLAATMQSVSDAMNQVKSITETTTTKPASTTARTGSSSNLLSKTTSTLPKPAPSNNTAASTATTKSIAVVNNRVTNTDTSNIVIRGGGGGLKSAASTDVGDLPPTPPIANNTPILPKQEIFDPSEDLNILCGKNKENTNQNQNTPEARMAMALEIFELLKSESSLPESMRNFNNVLIDIEPEWQAIQQDTQITPDLSLKEFLEDVKGETIMNRMTVLDQWIYDADVENTKKILSEPMKVENPEDDEFIREVLRSVGKL